MTVSAEAPTKPAMPSRLEQIKAVGADGEDDWRFSSPARMLAVIKEVGGLKKFKDLLDAIAVSGVGEARGNSIFQQENSS